MALRYHYKIWALRGAADSIFLHSPRESKVHCASKNLLISFSGQLPVTLNQPDATLFDLKTELEEEICVIPTRQRLFYLSYEILDDNLIIRDVVKRFGENMFSLVLPRAIGPGFVGPLPSQRFLVIGKSIFRFF